jgi:hypothetical protein
MNRYSSQPSFAAAVPTSTLPDNNDSVLNENQFHSSSPGMSFSDLAISQGKSL